MSIEGSIDLALYLRDGAIRRAAVRSRRPLRASRLLEGKARPAAQASVPLLFSICGRAQAVAAAGAMEAALGLEADPRVALRREVMVAAEWAQEYAWRIFLDLPVLLGEGPQADIFAALRRELQGLLPRSAAPGAWWSHGPSPAESERCIAVATVLSQVLRDHVFGMESAEWLTQESVAGLKAWFESCGTPAARGLRRLWPSPVGRSAVALLPRRRPEQWAADLAGPIAANTDFAAMPTWNGLPAETGALSRTAGLPLIAAALAEVGNTAAVRLLARLTELALLARRLAALARGEGGDASTGAAMLGGGAGMGAAETARGILLHYVELGRDETVGRYRIVAPTEWNFHPEGAFVQGLAGIAVSSAEEARRAAVLMAQALDPCVAYHVEVVDA